MERFGYYQPGLFSRPLLLLLMLLLLAQVTLSAGEKKNVLFLVSDDMRPQLEAYYGPDFPSPVHPRMHTPALDALAKRSLLLKQAYVQVALCSPSRTSLLTGRRPDTTHVYKNGPYFRKVGGNFTTLPEYFKENGYLSIGMGKIFHPGPASGGDDPVSWSEPYWHAPNYAYWGGFNVSWQAVPPYMCEEHPLPDDQIVEHALETLRRVAPKGKTGEQPFFVAVGFHKPHLPFVFPEEFLSLYPEAEIRMPPNPYAPVDMPHDAWYNYGGLRRHKDIKKLNATGAINTTLPHDVVLQLRRAYYSSISYIDSLVAKVISGMEELGLANNTIVSFWGDHGYQLGEHAEWCKQTNFELATHAPMMVHIPGLTDEGIETEEMTEHIDLFPTLVEAAGLPSMELCPEDSSQVNLCREGQSLMPLINSPTEAKWKERVFSQYPRNTAMGYTMRTRRYRYTEWPEFNHKKYKPNWEKLHGVELYDHEKDPEENVNVASDASYKDLVKELSKLLHAGWREAIV